MRRGQQLGKVRHLATADLWVQQRIRAGDISVAKDPGVNNGADLMTKYLGRADTLRLLGRVGFTRLQGRPTIAPKRNLGWDVGNPVPYLKDDIPGGGGEGSTQEVLELGCDLGTTYHLHQMPLMSCTFEG